jgi:hypothetical protein
MPKNIVGSVRCAGLVVQPDVEHEQLMAIIMSELANGAEKMLLHERVQAETEHAIASDEDRDDLEMDLQ